MYVVHENINCHLDRGDKSPLYKSGI